ncbi:eukaryotic translation initiation factor 2-alpha kinase 1-like [Orbicella faveolata]|uniref:eukaryotic translation initiation factor 2-alpha kinase 1-like n=1 Tax=Orbicella faveolata TaxID=48498 RepID=UPI0009E2906D|nr:eukaryotic translation initiation factor 2-alpha kinase 1-like [Orbicella faveolata]
MAWNTRSKWTRSKLEAPRLPPRLTEFQDADLTDTYVPNDDPSTSVQALEGRVPNYLLLVSLLEHLCSLYENDPEKSKKIFNVLCQQLVKMKVMPSFSFLEEFSVIRAKYKTAFSDLMQAAARTTGTDLVKIPGLRKPPLGPFHSYRSLSAPQKMHDLLQNGTSRYKEEFVEIIRLGKGGFGSVFKVKNKLDGREYAVKKVPLKETDPDLCLKVLREVKVLANLSHSNVVGYHAAWLEYVTTDTVGVALPRVATVPTSLKELSDFSSLNGIHRIMEVSQDSQSIVFESSSQDPSNSGILFAARRSSCESVGTGSQAEGKQRGAQGEGRLGKIPSSNLRSSTSSSRSSRAPYHASRRSMRRSVSSTSLGSMAGKDGDHIDDELSGEMSSEHGSVLTENIMRRKAVNKRLGMVLFIQMQLCTTTLRDWLVKRNENITVPDSQVDKAAIVDIFRQVVEGVRYIHSQALLHRDLKPRNIFLHGLRHHKEERPTSFQVKIGDFGLARKEVVVSPGASSPLASLIEPLTPLFPPGFSGKDAPTAGVGTCTYASPEQLRNNIYDNKADIYSLGIILFELFCPFGTEMERVKNIKDLRQGRLPQDFCEQWPEESKLILKMIDENPSNRPTAESLLELDVFKEEHTQMSDYLNEKVKEQASEIIELRKMLLKKEEELDARTDEVSKLRRQLEERDKLIEQMFNNKLCAACSHRLVNQVEEMDTG